MAKIYLVQMEVGECDDKAIINLKAFRNFTRAQNYLDQKQFEFEEETKLVEWIFEKFNEFHASYPEPKRKHLSLMECEEKGLVWSEENPFWEQVYESEYRQAHEEWENLWFEVLENRLRTNGFDLFRLNPEDEKSFKHDYRNFGQQRWDGNVWFGIDYVELGD